MCSTNSRGSIELVLSDSSQVKRQIVQRLIALNGAQVGSENSSDVVIVSRDSGNELIGGIVGYTQWNRLFVSRLWISEEARGAGLGSRLLKAAEALAIERRCDNAHLDTYSFQALDFYRKHGYTIFGQLNDFPTGHTRYFLQKRLQLIM